MKFAILLCVLSVLLVHQTVASPIKLGERQERALARQQSAGVAPAVQAVDEDDDDDDDEDDDDYGPDLGELVEDDDVVFVSGLSDDDDDDEEDDDDDEEDDRPQGQAAPAAATSDDDDDEDDDDDDYLDRLFDDILGEEDDDDDDDDDIVSPVANVQRPVVAPINPVEDLSSPSQITSAALSDGVDLPAESGNAVETIATDNSIDPNVAPLTSINNEGSLKNNNIIDMTADAFQERNNHFVDAIFARINQIVANSYDPFIVQLSGRTAMKPNIQKTQSHTASNNKSKAKGNKPSPAKTSIKKLKNTKSEPRTHTASIEAVADSNTIGNSEQNLSSASQEYEKRIESKTQTQLQQERQQLEKLQNHQQQLQQHKYIVENKQIDDDAGVPNNEKKTETQTEDNDNRQPEKRTAFVNEAAVKSGHESRKTSTKSHKQSAVKKGQNAGGASTTTVNSNNNNVKKKQKTASTSTINSNNKIDKASKDGEVQKAQGSLTGLASLKRVGNVKVVTDPEGRNSTIKAKFTLGPLILRVEKSFKRAGVENVKSATARTNEMIGRIKFGVVNDRATLISIKVQQPKQVEVESKDNHDRTREFVWRRTPKIARLVNEKLKLAADMLFAPQGVPAVRL
ncbi:acidic repeat-containing protein isoform X3 [Glossina fuscipes]|uniref:Acidic repeat-containing protein isoform X3 n=1 Tax=Glossina fuscipes TaxID=7396 RepID=A0A8U0W439_9MUSC|nr:acidic repeat-containing protein isoform X3 [Glossina fuscipes]